MATSEPPAATLAVHMQRIVTVVLDCSENMKDQDFAPTRMVCVFRSILRFVHEFFEKNPLSLLHFIASANGLAMSISAPSGNIERQRVALKQLMKAVSMGGANAQASAAPTAPSGEPSLERSMLKGDISLTNALSMAIQAHRQASTASTFAGQTAQGRSGVNAAEHEVIVILGALTTQDPSNIFAAIERARKSEIAIHTVHLAAEMYICKFMAEKTGGKHFVAMDEGHLANILTELANPSTATAAAMSRSKTVAVEGPTAQSAAVKVTQLLMGFPMPAHYYYTNATEEDVEAGERPDVASTREDLVCPQCRATVEPSKFFRKGANDKLEKVTKEVSTQSNDIFPCNCRVCGLLLVRSSQLARSYFKLAQAELEALTLAEEAEFVRGYGSAMDVEGDDEPSGPPASPTCCGCQRPILVIESTTRTKKAEETKAARIPGTTAPKSEAPKSLIQRCTHCRELFCQECADLILNVLFNCPGCLQKTHMT